MACQAGHWNIVTLLGKSRGLQQEVVVALGQMLQSARAPRATDKEFCYALSEPSLAQSLLILGWYRKGILFLKTTLGFWLFSGQSSQTIFNYIRCNINVFPLEILKRFAVQLDPSQPCAIPLVSRLFQNTKYSSSLDTTIESLDLDNSDKSVVVVKDFIETFLTVIVYLCFKMEKNRWVDILYCYRISPNFCIW